MTGGAFLPATTTSPVFLGTYLSTSPYPNPIGTPSSGTYAGFNANTLTFFEEKDPSVYPPGDFDVLAYYPYLTGPFKDT
jgi:hypothetical protein